MSVILVAFSNAPTPCQEAIEKVNDSFLLLNSVAWSGPVHKRKYSCNLVHTNSG